MQFDDDKDENGTKEQIVNYSEVTGPDMLGVVLEESAPGLAAGDDDYFYAKLCGRLRRVRRERGRKG